VRRGDFAERGQPGEVGAARAEHVEQRGLEAACVVADVAAELLRLGERERPADMSPHLVLKKVEHSE
jgi:hypothetical protein